MELRSRFLKDINKRYQHDLERIANDVQSFPADHLWDVPGDIKNSAGVLAQHVIGNLHHFIGAGLGDTGYQRNREREFSKTDQTKQELIEQLDEVKQMVQQVLDDVSSTDLEKPYPLQPFDEENVQFVIMHLLVHLNYHHGQLNYLRRLTTEIN